VPAVGARALSTPVVVYDATPRTRLDTFPRIVASARAAVTFGQDSVAPIYVEGYTDSAVDAPARLPLRVVARGERDVVVWTDTVALDRQPSATPAAGAARGLYGGVVRVPVARVGIGVVSLTVSRAGGPADEGAGGGADSARTTIFVNLGEDLPITAFGEALDYLRYYAAPERLRALRDAAPEARAVAWAAFLRESDPVTATAEHEGLREYFARIRAANARFSEDGGPGWLSDRGMAFVGVGEPDQIFDPGGPDINVRGRQQIWEYRSPRLQLVFVDQTGFGRWRLAPSSLVEVQSIIRRRQVR
jgi:GWxTD domain-containing protein